MTQFTRRDVLKIGAAGTATAILAGCSQDAERWVELEPYVRAPEDQLPGNPTYYATTCRMCPAACGILVKLTNGRAIKIEGNPEHPVSRGKTCARGQAGLQLLYNPDRVTTAVMQEERGKRKFKALAWNEAINTLIKKIEAADGQVAVWTGSTTSGHLYDLFSLFTDAIGSSDLIRYDLYSAINGYAALTTISEQLTGQAVLPSYDLGHADAIFSFGADFLGTWHNANAYGVEFGNFRDQAYGKRGYLVQFEPKMSITGAKADKWVPVKPGAEALVAQAIARIIAEEKLGSPERIERAETLTPEVDLEAAAAACELQVEDLVTFARAFAEAEHPVALPGEALIGRTNSLDALLAVQALNVIAGTVGEAGSMMITPSLSGSEMQPAAASTFEQVQTLVERMNAGEIKVLLVHGANPLYDLPESLGFAEALANVETVVSFNPMLDETAAYADYILPNRVYLEGWGYEVVNPGFQGLPVVSGQQPVVGPFHDVRATGDVLLTIAQRLDATASTLPWTDEVAFIKEKITNLPAGMYGGDDPDFQWARYQQFGGWWPETAPADPITADLAQVIEVPAAEFDGAEDEFPYFLHLYLPVLLSDGSGANTPWLQGSPDPLTTISWQSWVEANPKTADELGVKNGDIVKIESPNGKIEAPVYVFPAIRPDTIAIPLGQGHTDYGRYAKERGTNPVNLLGTTRDGKSNTIWAWSNVRVKLVKTDDTQDLAVYESKADAAKDAHVPF
ncbi:MAG: molybdopterin-dependent oxidoreductase [Anaerolineae bacterium]|nr:molybdopterin-dependent oxidoreductase [Anaerolineae bacterium]